MPGKKPDSATPSRQAHGVELARGADERGAAGDDAPGDEDAADPDAGADLVEDEVAGDFEEEVAEEEDAGAEAVDAVANLRSPSICSLAKPTLTRSM